MNRLKTIGLNKDRVSIVCRRVKRGKMAFFLKTTLVLMKTVKLNINLFNHVAWKTEILQQNSQTMNQYLILTMILTDC